MTAVFAEATSGAVSLAERREKGGPLLKELSECVGEAQRWREQRNLLIAAAARRRLPVVDIARCAGLSRKAVYRIIEAEAS